MTTVSPNGTILVFHLAETAQGERHGISFAPLFGEYLSESQYATLAENDREMRRGAGGLRLTGVLHGTFLDYEGAVEHGAAAGLCAECKQKAKGKEHG